eukprot:NODE_1081_length_1011_cov_161.521830_g897_i0.p1 GENE.NODE_1081_length_1011_cov_161.521830_g897_i0~~NODE_1081_length_1011_cov_161.521830_g897_i0.p1  ORF type:complete len:274 (-),score=49.89 NODE_1081_length_1011_cov_161.521830_g897_i0:129-950(-)
MGSSPSKPTSAGGQSSATLLNPKPLTKAAAEAVKAVFPGAVELPSFVKATHTAVAPHHFTPDGTLACVCICRDEICRPLMSEVVGVYPLTFEFTGLGATLLVGKTGMGAALHHCPEVNGKEFAVFYVFPHIAISSEGHWGGCSRRGREAESQACGALVGLLKQLQGGSPSTDIDKNDVEFSYLRQMMVERLAGKSPADLPNLTIEAQKLNVATLQALIKGAAPEHMDFAVFAGVQIHAPNADYIAPLVHYAVIHGKEHPLKLEGMVEMVVPDS